MHQQRATQRRHVEHARVHQELSQVATDRSRRRRIGRPDLDQQQADGAGRGLQDRYLLLAGNRATVRDRWKTSSSPTSLVS